MKIYQKNNKGFTLIELLVVVAIIGLLSSIVLASLNSARTRAKDAAIKEAAYQLSTVMAFNYNDYGDYCNLQSGWITASGPTYTCNQIFSGTYAVKARDICANIFNNAGDIWGPTGAYRIYSNTSIGCGSTYSFMIALNNGKWFCTGSSGAKGEYVSYGDPPNSNPGCYGNP